MNVAIIGATGVVGLELVRLLSESSLTINTLHLFARQDGDQKRMTFRDQDNIVKPFISSDDVNADLVFLCVEADFSRAHTYTFVQRGMRVIDLSDAFRMDPDTPLVIPEINGHILKKSHSLIANPNCTTSLIAVSLQPLMKITHVLSVYASTYQAASGAGLKGMSSLVEEINMCRERVPFAPSVFPHPLHLNLIPKISHIDSDGVSGEEKKVIDELKKIFSLPDLRVGCTAVRIPTMRSHAVSLLVGCSDPVDPDLWRKEIMLSPALCLKDQPEYEIYPMPLTASAMPTVEVGRLRCSTFLEPYSVEYFIVGDQLLKGAALNAVQIAEAWFV